MAAENALSVASFCVAERPSCYLRRQTQPSCVETVKVAGERLFPGIQFLQKQIKRLSDAGDVKIVDAKAVKLVSVDGHMPLPGKLPLILLIHRYANQVGHDLSKSVIVVAFNPDHFLFMLGIGELADIPQKLPMLLGQAAEIQVSKNIAQQDQPPEVQGLQEFQRVLCATYLGSQVEIRDNDRVVVFPQHAPWL